jgi:hypothetical protein
MKLLQSDPRKVLFQRALRLADDISRIGTEGLSSSLCCG